MALIHIILCVIIACAQSGSSIPFSDGNFGHNGHEHNGHHEWFTNQNFEGPHNEFNSQQFSLINRNGGEFIPRNNFQNNVPPHINNFPNNGYREFINTPNFNFVSKIESSGVNPMNYHNFERHNVNSQAGAIVGQNFNQEAIQVNKDVAEMNQIIAQENLAALEREKIRESSFQQNYVPNVIQRRQQIEPSQTYFPQNLHFETHQPVMQNIRPETLIPVIQQVQSQDQNTARQKSIPVLPLATTQRDTEEEKKSFEVIYPDGKKERVTDIDKFIKDNPELIIQRRYRSPQPPIQNIPAPQQQIVLQTHSQETLQQFKLKPDEQNISPQIQAPQSQKPFIQQLTPQNVITSKELQEKNIDKSSLPVQSNINLVTMPKRIEIETQTPIATKPLSGNPKSGEIVVPIVATSLKDIIKTVFENVNQKQTVESYSYSGNDTQQPSFKPQSMTQKVIETVPVPERKIIDINWHQKQPTESLEFLTHFSNGEKLTQNNKSHNDLVTSNVLKTQILTPQILSNNEQIVTKEKEQSVEENGTSKNGSLKKFGEIENITIPEIVFKIEDLNTQTKQNSKSKKIIVSEEVITVPKKEEIEIEVAEVVENGEVSGKPVIIEKITINEVKPNDKQNKSKKKRPTEEIIIKEETYPGNYYKFDEDRKVKSPLTFDSKKFKDTLKKSKKIKSKKKDKKVVKKEKKIEESVQQVQPVIEEIIFTEEVEQESNYKSENDENQSPQQKESVMQKEVIEEEVEPEDDNQSKRPDQRNSKEEEEVKRIYKPKNKEEFIIEENKWVEEDDSEYIKKVKGSIRKEKLVNKEIIRNGESKRRNEIKQEDGMTIITTNADKFYVEEVNKEELAKLEKELNAEDSSERRWLAKEAFVFKTSDSTIPESIKKHYKDSNKPIYLFQLIFPSVVDREVITTIYSNGTSVEEVNEYLRQTGAEQQEDKKRKKEEKGERRITEERERSEEGRRTEERKRIEERKRVEEERKKKEVERKKRDEKSKSREREVKSREEERKTTEEETKNIREERKRTEEERKRSGEEHKRITKVKKRKEEERKRREKEYRKREEKRTKRGRKKSVEERKSMQEKNTRSVKERKSTTSEYKKRKEIEEEHKRRKEHRRREEERKKRETEYRKKEKERKVREEEKKKTEKEHKMRRENRRKEEQRRKREKKYKRKLEERKKKKEEEDCED